MNQESNTSGQYNTPIVDEYCLRLQEYALSMAAQKEIVIDKAIAQKWVEGNLYQLQLSHRIPADVLQQDVEICRYPASNWQWFKKFIPFAKPKYKIHYLTEHLTFPGVKVPSNIQNEMRIFIERGIKKGAEGEINNSGR